ncbi:MAG TPA: YciI family protein [Candidatus Acidoferrales bacterium]|nr:YciI family protein [Candidatus Acidoferrales bacterium]
MSEFVFLYRGGRRADSPSEGEKQMQRWMAWFQELGSKGHLKDRGQPLETEGKVVRGRDRTVTDGPYAESKDLVGGFTLIEATNLAQAAELAGGCPIFESDGLVEVRPIMQM